VRAMLGIGPNAVPEFGYKPRTPLLGNRRDNTEIDMRLGELLVEAKLTESEFQSAKVGLISRYRDLETVFHIEELPSMNGRHSNYQLIHWLGTSQPWLVNWSPAISFAFDIPFTVIRTSPNSRCTSGRSAQAARFAIL
jgi:hypothetical protein